MTIQRRRGRLRVTRRGGAVSLHVACFRKNSDICPQHSERTLTSLERLLMKKLLGLLAVGAFSLFLVDCSKSEPPAPATTQAPTPSASASAAASAAPAPAPV